MVLIGHGLVDCVVVVWVRIEYTRLVLLNRPFIFV